MACWLALGVVLTLPAHGARIWLPAGALAGASVAEIARLRHFVGRPDFPSDDFSIVFESARRLYRLGLDPYTDPRANAFPFPALAIFDATGLWGRLDAADAARVFLGINALALLVTLVAVAAVARREIGGGASATTALLFPALVLHPGVVQVLAFGQTGILVALWATLGVWAWRRGASPWLTGAFFTLAWMQKPYLVVAALFFVACAVRDRTVHGRLSREGRIGVAVVVLALTVPLVLVLIPGGVTWTTFVQFAGGLRRLQEIYSRSWADNYSPVAIVLHRALAAWRFDYGAAVHAASAAAILLVVGGGVVALRGARHRFFAGLAWIAASQVPFSVTYKHYYPWLLPALFPTLRLALERRLDTPTTVLLCASVAMLHLLTVPGFTVGTIGLVLACHLAARRAHGGSTDAVSAKEGLATAWRTGAGGGS